jgi:hypothetical protein
MSQSKAAPAAVLARLNRIASRILPIVGGGDHAAQELCRFFPAPRDLPNLFGDKAAAMTRESFHPYINAGAFSASTALNNRARQFVAAGNCNRGGTRSLS